METADGPRRRYVSGKNKGETRAALGKAKAGREGGVCSDAGTTKLGEYLDGWLEDTRGTIRQRTRGRYEQIVRVHLNPALGRNPMETFTETKTIITNPR